MTYPKLICLLAFFPIIFSHSTPLIPTDPAIRFQITKKAFQKFEELLMERFWLSPYFNFGINLDNTDFEASIVRTGISAARIEVLESTRASFPSVGFTRVEPEIHTLHRKKRDAPTHTKVYYEDSEFVAGQEIGGVRVSCEGVSYRVILNGDNERYMYELSNVTETVQIYLGQKDGNLKIARIAAEANADLKARKINEDITLTVEKKNEFLQELLKSLIKKSLSLFSSVFHDENQLFGSRSYDKFVFDQRFTEHPQFTNGEVHLSFVGKFVYDREEIYLGKTLLPKIDKVLNTLRSYRHARDLNTAENTYKMDFVVNDSNETPKLNSLTAEESEERESQMKANGCYKIHLEEDLFNSLYDVLEKIGLTKVKLPRLALKYLAENYNEMLGTPIFKTQDFPRDLELYFDIQRFGSEEKFFTFNNGRLINKFVIAVMYKELVAKYKVHTEVGFLFRNKTLFDEPAYIKVEVEADEGFPKIFDATKINVILNKYQEILREKYFRNKIILEDFTELALEDQALTFGITCSSFLTDFRRYI